MVKLALGRIWLNSEVYQAVMAAVPWMVRFEVMWTAVGVYRLTTWLGSWVFSAAIYLSQISFGIGAPDQL